MRVRTHAKESAQYAAVENWKGRGATAVRAALIIKRIFRSQSQPTSKRDFPPKTGLGGGMDVLAVLAARFQ